MTERIDPNEMSQAELDEYLDKLTREGKDETPEFRRAFKVWEMSTAVKAARNALLAYDVSDEASAIWAVVARGTIEKLREALDERFALAYASSASTLTKKSRNKWPNSMTRESSTP